MAERRSLVLLLLVALAVGGAHAQEPRRFRLGYMATRSEVVPHHVSRTTTSQTGKQSERLRETYKQMQRDVQREKEKDERDTERDQSPGRSQAKAKPSNSSVVRRSVSFRHSLRFKVAQPAA